jgi:hypothetical protein
MYLLSTAKGSVAVLAAGVGHITVVPLLLLPPELLLLEELLLLPAPLLELLLVLPELLPEAPELLELLPSGLDDAAHALHARSGNKNQAEIGACAMRAFGRT